MFLCVALYAYDALRSWPVSRQSAVKKLRPVKNRRESSGANGGELVFQMRKGLFDTGGGWEFNLGAQKIIGYLHRLEMFRKIHFITDCIAHFVPR